MAKKPKADAGYGRSTTETERMDRQLAAEAIKKRQAGKKPTREESYALRRVERAREEHQRWVHYETIPQKHYLEMACRDRKVVVEQSRRHGLPFGKTIRLSDFIKWVHDFLSNNKYKLTSPATDDPLMEGDGSPALERYRMARAKLAELELEERKGNLIPRNAFHDLVAPVASLIRQAGERLKYRFGNEALEILDEQLDAAEYSIQQSMNQLYKGCTDDDNNTITPE